MRRLQLPHPYRMPHPAVLIPELEQAIRHGSASRRAEMAERVTDLFVDDADRFDADQVALFDDVLHRLIEQIEGDSLKRIARRLAPVESAPVDVVRRLAADDDIAIAGPLLRRSPRLADSDLTALASRLGPAHLLAISQRPDIAEPVTDLLLARGDRRIVQTVAGNRGARISDFGFDTLVKRAARDHRLAETVGLRPDLSEKHLNDLLQAATEIVRRRLYAAVGVDGADRRGEVSQALAEAAAEARSRIAAAYGDAQRAILALMRADKLGETELGAFARNGQFEHAVAALSALSRVPIEVVERLMRVERPDALIVLCRAIGIEWTTVRAIIAACGGPTRGAKLEEARLNFERLSAASAERLARFWRGRARIRTASSGDLT
jgi:uncharacterized protein (DUF2336 family)